ncbi:MAG: crossover junction endodeoxyribonuclease RuvC [Myxococcales bacterium]|nr:crossover junction endodeoxyribonuclease RuvC [Myxococcales bacterium]
MRILGVDPGTRRCGYGVIEAARGRLSYIECGVIVPPAKASLERRLATLLAELGEVIDELDPVEVAVEDIFHGIDARAALTLGHARGVVLAAAGRAALVVHAYPPATVKRSVTGYGRADKPQVGSMVRTLLALKRVPRADAADALAVAICHAHHQGGLARKRAP